LRIQGADVFLFQLLNLQCLLRLNRLLFSKLWVEINFALALHKSFHMLFDEWPSDYVNDFWPGRFIFHEQQID